MDWLKKIYYYFFFFIRGAKDIDWRTMPKDLSEEARYHWQRTNKTIKKTYSKHLKTSAHLPPNFYLLWEGVILFWRGRKPLFKIIFAPWIVATIISSAFTILLPKSLLFNYGLSSLINYLLIALCVYPFAFWAIGESTEGKTLSLRFSSWNAQKKDFILKILLWLFVFGVIFFSCFFVINNFFEFLQDMLPGRFRDFITGLILLCYIIVVFGLMYFFASWLLFIPYIIFQSRFHLLSIKELYDLEGLEDELKIFFAIVRQYHIWIFLLFITILAVPVLVGSLGLIFAAAIYYLGALATYSLPLFIRSSIIQVILMSAVTLLVTFVSVTIISIILSRAFWLLRYKKSASFPKI